MTLEHKTTSQELCLDMECAILDETGFAIRDSLTKDEIPDIRKAKRFWVWIEPNQLHNFGLEPFYDESDCK